MGSGIFFPVLSLFYSVLLIVLCFKDKKIKNNILKSLVIVNFIGLISELLCSYAAFNIKKMPILSNFILKFYLVYLVTWIILFTKYISNISNDGIITVGCLQKDLPISRRNFVPFKAAFFEYVRKHSRVL